MHLFSCDSRGAASRPYPPSPGEPVPSVHPVEAPVLDSSARSFSQRGNSLRTRPSLFSPFRRETMPAQASTDFLIQHPRLFPRGHPYAMWGFRTACGSPNEDHMFGATSVGYLPPLSRRAGSVMIALRRSKTASTVMPRSRKGRDRSQTNGYRSKARRASGQHKTRRISQSKNFMILPPLFNRQWSRVSLSGVQRAFSSCLLTIAY